MTDEDRMIKRLENHRDLIGYVINSLQEKGIKSQRTTNNTPGSDIILLDAGQTELAKKVITSFTEKKNGKKTKA